METWHKLMEDLVEAGVSDDALELARRSTAPARHEWRVAQTRQAALDAGEGDSRRAIGEIVLDLIGIGGVRSLGGDSGGTLRRDAFHHCGKGRKRASDGPSWMGAARSALWQLCAEVGAVDEYGTPIIEIHPFGDGLEVCDRFFDRDEWTLTAARRGFLSALKSSAGDAVRVEGLDDDMAGILVFTGSLSDWSVALAGGGSPIQQL